MAYQHGVNRIKRFGLGIAVVGTLLIVPLSLIPLYTGNARDNGYFAAFLFLFSVPQWQFLEYFEPLPDTKKKTRKPA